MKFRVIGLSAILLLGAGLALSQNPVPPPTHQGHPPSAPAAEPAFVAVPQQPPPGQHAPTRPNAPQPHVAAPAIQPPHPPHHPDLLAENLFPPELVMQHKQAIGLTDEQKNAIRDELIKASTHFSQLQFQIQDEMENLVTLTKDTTVDEQRVLAQLDKVLSIEREVKRAQMSVSIRIKNKLTAEQQERLQQIRRGHPPR